MCYGYGYAVSGRRQKNKYAYLRRNVSVCLNTRVLNSRPHFIRPVIIHSFMGIFLVVAALRKAALPMRIQVADKCFVSIFIFRVMGHIYRNLFRREVKAEEISKRKTRKW